MDRTCYKLPIRFDALSGENGKESAMCSELESIDQHIELLLTTCPGEHKFDKNYGCRIWDMDFERVVFREKWESDFKRYIEEAIIKYEPRLREVSVTIRIMEVVKEDKVMKSTAIKKKVQVLVDAIRASCGEGCGFNYALYLGPLTTE